MVVQSAAVCSLPNAEVTVAARHRVTINLEDREYAELAALSERHRVSLAWLGRRAIIELLERSESEGLQLPLDLPTEARPAGR